MSGTRKSLRPWASIGTERFENERGVVETMHLAPGVLGSVMSGHLDEALTRLVLRYTDRVLERDGPTTMFHDWERMAGYDAVARKLCADYAVSQYRMVRGAHMLVSSSIVAMGISTANLITWPVGVKLVAHRDRKSFEDARAAAISP